jgi:CDP-glucose 4,6-dehydratase
VSSSRYQGVAVLVTGAQGFIGSWLVERLLGEGAAVVVPRREVDEGSRFRREGLDARTEQVAMDLLDLPSLVRAVNEHEVREVFHLAAGTIVADANRSPMEAMDVNVRGTYNLMEACRVVGTPEAVVVASSYHAYARDADHALQEDSPLGSAWPYDVSKACADMIARCYAASWELPVAVTRLANVYGGGDLNYSRLVPDAARALVGGDAPVINSDGTPERDFVYVEDAVEAYLAVASALREGRHRGQAWNAGSGESVAVAEVVRRLVGASGRDLEPDIRGERTARDDVDRQYLDSGAIARDLGWSPAWTLDEGLRKTYAWYESALA